MRKYIILFLALFLTIKFSTGQIISIEAGKNWSNLKWENDQEIPGYTETLNGGSLFLSADYFNKKFISFSSGLGFINKSGNNEYKYRREGWGYVTTYSKSNLCYLSVNTAINFKYPIANKFIPYLAAGPRLDYLISDKNESSRLGKMNSTIIGLRLGGGLKYNISKVQIGLQLDYHINSDKIAEIPQRPSYAGYFGAAQVYEHATSLRLIIGYNLK